MASPDALEVDKPSPGSIRASLPQAALLVRLADCSERLDIATKVPYRIWQSPYQGTQ